MILGVEARSAGSLVFRFAALRRAKSRLIESVNVNVTRNDYVLLGIPDPYIDFVRPADDRILPMYDRKPSSFGRDRYVLTNPPDHTSRHEDFEMTLAKTAGRFRFLGKATAYRSESKTNYRGFRV